MKPQFEESQFAVFFQDDLSHRKHGPVQLAPIGQVLEAKVGFDLGGWVPRAHPMWSVLHSAPLPGLSRRAWNPSLSQTAAVTSKALNVFFQFKRPDHLYRPNATYFANLGGPYWRFYVKGHWFLPRGGRGTCPVTVTRSARWWPWDLPSADHHRPGIQLNGLTP